jgi:hypothetical protein
MRLGKTQKTVKRGKSLTPLDFTPLRVMSAYKIDFM